MDLKQQARWKILTLLELHRSSEISTLVHETKWRVGNDTSPLYSHPQVFIDILKKLVTEDVDHGIFVALQASSLL